MLKEINFIDCALVFASSLILSLCLMPVTVYFLIKFDILDHPNYRKIHKKPIPRMAGITIYFAFVIPLAFYFKYIVSDSALYTPWSGILLGSSFALLIGCADDIWNVPATLKLLFLFLLTLLIWRFGVITNLPVSAVFGIHNHFFHVAVNLVITMLWLVGITSAMNALDHMDGMAGSIAVIAAVSYFFVSIQTSQFTWTIISLALMGSLLGFLRYNWHPAKVFMGESGSFFLGFCLASISILGGWSSDPVKASIIPVAVMSLPIFDLGYVIIARRMKGITHSIAESITYCGKDHIGHRLNKLGFTQPMAVFMVCLMAATVSISALTIRQVNYIESALLMIQIIMIYSTVAFFMEVILKRKNLQKK
jgi:UDP-GlcNAc:undecaprenyl-phosphate GlcNAc-1-phosphate transferase